MNCFKDRSSNTFGQRLSNLWYKCIKIGECLEINLTDDEIIKNFEDDIVTIDFDSQCI